MAHMAHMARSRKPTAWLITLIAALAALVVTGVYVWSSRTATMRSQPSGAGGGSPIFTGTVTKDTCTNPTTTAPVGDVGCALTVDNNTVEIVHGNVLYPNGWGTVRGFAPLSDNIVGHTVEVVARHVGSGAYDLAGPGYFVKLLN